MSGWRMGDQAGRSPGHRELAPLDRPLVAQLLAAFPRHAEQRLHAFRLIELGAPTPVVLDPAALADAALFRARARVGPSRDPAVRSGAG